ncbi:hypothetical protein Tco_1139237, partial [Tanacetum coccineum]
DGGINETNTEIIVKEAEKETGAENGTKNKPIKRAEREESVEASSSQPVGYYLKHRINEKLIDGLVDNHRGPVYEAILRKKIKKKEDIGGNFEIPCNIGDVAGVPEPLYKVKKGIKNNVEPIAHTMTVNRLVLEWEERIRLNQEKEMEFDQ